MQVWEAVVLGVVQGLTEFLPISSTAHLLVARQLMGHADPKDAYTTVIQLGTLVAVFVYFRADVRRLLGALRDDVRAFRPGTTPDSRQGWLIVLGTLPVVAVGFLFKKWVKATFYDVQSIAVVSLVFAALLFASERSSAHRKRLGKVEKQESEIGWSDAVWIGCFQALALMPGASRSGTTITAGLFAGLARPAAARFSFLLSLPAVLGAGLKELYDDWSELSKEGEVTSLVVGLVVSGIVGYFAIAWLLGFLKKYSTYGFVVYRIVLGVCILALVAGHVIR